MNTTQEKIKDTVDDLAKRAHNATDAAAQGGKRIADQGAGVAGAIRDKAQQAASAVGDFAEQAKDSVQHLASDAADSVKHAKDATVQWASDVAQHPGDSLKAGTDEVAHLIRRYPISAILIGVGIGFMLAKATRI